MREPLATIVEFLESIGIPTRRGEVCADSFLPAVRIADGGLVFDPHNLRWPGDLLHEAGHLAVTPAAQRAALSDALDAAEAAPHGGELEAIAWSWAAAVHLKLPPDLLFHSGGYKGQSASLLMSYSLGVYPGAHGLAQAGLTRVGADAAEAGVAAYPNMLRWLRE
jgi:hypothetical protein